MINDWTAVVVVVSKNHMFELMMHTPGVRNDKTFTHCIKISHKVSIIFDKSNPTQREKKKNLSSNIDRKFEVHNPFIIVINLRFFIILEL